MLPRIERRRHWREASPAAPNGLTYSLRGLAVSVPLVASDLLALLGSVAALVLSAPWAHLTASVGDVLDPVERSRAVTVPESDHRMVVSDLVFQ